jgi:uncharacterized protein YutE (UPF0331/DUF86 family)
VNLRVIILKTIEKKIKAVQDRVKRLEQLSGTISSFSEYQTSPDSKDIAERNIQVAVEGCLDIAKIVISSKELPEPKDNKGVFTVLAEAGILSDASLKFLVPMAGTRNVLVHGYDKVEDSVIYEVMKRHLDDFNSFLKEIKENYLDRTNGTDSSG